MLQDKLQQTGGWRLEVHHVEAKLCTGMPAASRAAGTSAYTTAQLQTALTLLGVDIRGRLVQSALSPYVQRPHSFSTSMSSTLTQAVRMDSHGGPPDEVLKRLPAMAAAFREMGWHCEIIIEGSETMRKIILEQAEQQHKNDQKEKGTKEPFDASIFEGMFPPDKKYVTQVSLAPPWIEAAYPELSPVSMSDFAHCEQTKDSMPAAASIMYASLHTRPTGFRDVKRAESCRIVTWVLSMLCT